MRLAIIIPVFNDWAAVSRLTDALELNDAFVDVELCLFVVDDGSSEPAIINFSAKLDRVREIEIIRLSCNLGHQRAITVGLIEACKSKNFDACVIMDSDGEDRPADIPRLLAEAEKMPGHIVCAKRSRRPGRLAFRLWYEFYRVIFRIFTGSSIDFGNFCLIPGDKLEAMVGNPGIWNNIASALTRSHVPLTRLPCDRGTCYAGKSKMNFVSLVMFGLSAISVYSDIVMVRILLFTLVLISATLCAVIGVIAITLGSDFAIPGWATLVAGLLTVILFQALIISTISVLNILSIRSMNVFIPRRDAQNFILFRRKVFPPSSVADLDR